MNVTINLLLAKKHRKTILIRATCKVISPDFHMNTNIFKPKWFDVAVHFFSEISMKSTRVIDNVLQFLLLRHLSKEPG